MLFFLFYIHADTLLSIFSIDAFLSFYHIGRTPSGFRMLVIHFQQTVRLVLQFVCSFNGVLIKTLIEVTALLRSCVAVCKVLLL